MSLSSIEEEFAVVSQSCVKPNLGYKIWLVNFWQYWINNGGRTERVKKQKYNKAHNKETIFFLNKEYTCFIYICTALQFEIDSPFINKWRYEIIKDDMKADTNMIANKINMKSLNIYFIQRRVTSR